MDEYKAMYYHLFNAVTDALERLEAGELEETKEILYRAQCECEEMYISAPEGTGRALACPLKQR